MKNVKPPRGERAWTIYRNSKGEPVLLLTSKESNREYYYLYEVGADGSLTKLGRSKSPTELETKFDIEKRVKSDK